MTVSLLQLVKRKDLDNSDIDSVNLLSLPIELQYEGWQQATPQPEQPNVEDVITLLMNAGNDNALAAALQSIDTKIKEIQWAQDPLNPIGVWLRSQLTTESNIRQAFITAGRRSPGMRITDPLAYDSVLQQYQLGVTRMPFWENVLASTVGGSAISVHGGTVSYSIAGDAHARVAKVSVQPVGSASFKDVWFGVKSSRYGVIPANFVPMWNLDLSGWYGTDTTIVADATALDGNKLQCTFASDLTLVNRALVAANDVVAHPEDQRGRYIALLRAKLTNSSLVCNARVGTGYYVSGGGPPFPPPVSVAFQPRLRIINASNKWIYYPMGIIKIPPTAGFFEPPLTRVAIVVQAEKISGTGNLDMDSLILIPAEHSIHATCISPIKVGGEYLQILTRPDAKYYAALLNIATGSIVESVAPDQLSWSIPSGNGVLVGAASNDTNAVALQMMPTFTVYPAYSSLRGSA